jgi:LPS-assembly protein
MRVDPAGRIDLGRVRFTTCPAGDDSWQLEASEITLDTAERNGLGRSTRVEFKGVPIFYVPFISFPLGSERKSGFLFPSAGYTTRSGWQLAVPYYFNLAPNYDFTFEPVGLSRRGVDLSGEFRMLGRQQAGRFAFDYLPSDRLYEEDRSYVRLSHEARLPAGWRWRADAGNVSDNQYFEDFGDGPEGTSTAFVERVAAIGYRDTRWRVEALVQDFQTVAGDLAPLDRPYSSLPRLAAAGDFALDRAGRLRYGFDAEVVNFDRSAGITGWRADVEPHVGLALEGAGYYLRPAASWRATRYELDGNAPGEPDSPSRTLPMASLDAGLVFEGPSGSRGQRRVTLEPRALYLYAPFRDQDDLPVFDTALPDLNLVQLFRRNRYVGADRVSDANQLSVGVTSRLFTAADGRQIVAGTLGQILYFETPEVVLPGEPVRDRSTSDLVAQLELTAYRDWYADFGIQWNDDESERERMQARIQYRPAPDRVVNLGYRFKRDRVEQLEWSGAWPVSQRVSLFARYVHSLEDSRALDQFAGFEYRACCWRVRTVARRFVSSRTGERDTGVYLQLELTGLASVGSPAGTFLEESIRGYSPAQTTP